MGDSSSNIKSPLAGEPAGKLGGIMNFVALDFETANSKRSSACSLGLVAFENDKAVFEKE